MKKQFTHSSCLKRNSLVFQAETSALKAARSHFFAPVMWAQEVSDKFSSRSDERTFALTYLFIQPPWQVAAHRCSTGGPHALQGLAQPCWMALYGRLCRQDIFLLGKKQKRIIFKVNSHLNSAEQSLMLCRSTQEHRWLFLQCFAVPLQCMNTERLQPVFHLAQLRTASSCCSPARTRRARPYICCQETDCWQAETT